jgi:hypothetical protein
MDMQAVTSFFKKDNTAALARQEAAAGQRRAMAQMSRQGAETDAAGQRGGKNKGRSLLSFLGAEGSSGLAAA